jgi:hypothetical protein
VMLKSAKRAPPIDTLRGLGGHNGATLPLSLHQARVREHGQVCRNGVLWNYEARQLTSGRAVRFMADQQPERVEPGCLGKRRQSGGGF